MSSEKQSKKSSYTFRGAVGAGVRRSADFSKAVDEVVSASRRPLAASTSLLESLNPCNASLHTLIYLQGDIHLFQKREPGGGVHHGIRTPHNGSGGAHKRWIAMVA